MKSTREVTICFGSEKSDRNNQPEIDKCKLSSMSEELAKLITMHDCFAITSLLKQECFHETVLSTRIEYIKVGKGFHRREYATYPVSTLAEALLNDYQGTEQLTELLELLLTDSKRKDNKAVQQAFLEGMFPGQNPAEQFAWDKTKNKQINDALDSLFSHGANLRKKGHPKGEAVESVVKHAKEVLEGDLVWRGIEVPASPKNTIAHIALFLRINQALHGNDPVLKTHSNYFKKAANVFIALINAIARYLAPVRYEEGIFKPYITTSTKLQQEAEEMLFPKPQGLEPKVS